MKSSSRSSLDDAREQTDQLANLIAAPLQPLRPEWRDKRQEDELATAQRLDDRGPDSYWQWVAEQQHWHRRWTVVRRGALGHARWFEGGLINVSDNCLDRWADDPRTADKAAVIWEGEPGDTRAVTYRQLRDETARLAAGLRSLDIGKGDVVAIYMTNLVEAFTAIHACNRLGAVYTILFSGFGEDAVSARLEMAGAKLVVVPDAIYRRGRLIELLATLRAARAAAPSVLHTVVVDRTGRSIPLSTDEIGYQDLLDSHPVGIASEALDPNDPSFLIFTSGTEAQPKGLVHSVGGFLLGTWANVKWQVGPSPSDIYWVAADVGWLTFPIQAVVGGLAHGMTILCYEGALNNSPHRFYEICERHHVTKVLTAPTALRMLRGFGNEVASEHPLSDLNLVTVQGEPLDGETFVWASTRLGGGVPLVNAYGQTETGSTWSYPVYGVSELKPGSCGRPVPGHRAEVVDPSGAPVPPGTKGELVLTEPFPTLATTIWGDPQRYRQTYFDKYPGYYHTNDEAVFDDDGHLWVLGRADDVINVAAHRISTLEIEAVLSGNDEVVECAVVGVPDETKGTVPVAIVTTRPGSDTDEIATALAKQVTRAIGGIARVDRIYFAAALPKTRTGKIMRRLLREIVVSGAPRSDTSALENTDALQAVIDAVAMHQPTSQIP
ncbi:MAG TPA: AMP-binding protein [Acidimicrobiales bacterium]|nr:AMP-binding protein [Acidimicrobiales bacterium]